MLLWVTLLVSHYCWCLDGAAADRTGLERIEECGTSCSQGLQCKTKPDNWFPPPCQNPAEGVNRSSVFHNVDLSTVMRCEERQKCSLHLRIKTAMKLTESIHGLSVCTVTAGMMANCQMFSFRRGSRNRLSGLTVEVENDCTDISPRQRVHVTVKTLPSYCEVTWTGTYDAPECISEDLRRHVPECITGRLSYDVNPQTKELRVSVSDMLEDQDYHLRLCHKDFICSGTGAHRLINKAEHVKRAILPYSRPLPCLCIEGWSAVMDASRVQICPFEHRLEELWSGIDFDPLDETLSWEPICPVTATVVLCQKRGDAVCVDLPHGSQNVSREKEEHNAVGLNVKGKPCNSCLQVKRLDVKFSATVTHCLEQCSPTVVSSRVSRDRSWIILSATVLSGVIIFTSALYVLLTVYQKRKQNIFGGCISKKRTDPASYSVVMLSKPQPPVHGGFLIPDSPQCANLISK
ncbi:interleukin-17 receptor E-like protein isoform 4-T5 [Spinachia spinachia]